MKADEIREYFTYAAKYPWQWHGLPNGKFMLADENLSGPNGMHFTLFKESTHTKADVIECKRILRRERDVTGFTVLEVPLKDREAENHAPMNATCEKCGRRYCDHENKY